MSYRLELSPHVIKQLGGMLPEQREIVETALVETLAVVLVDPYDPVTTEPTPDPHKRQAIFGEVGIVEFLIWDELRVVVASNLLWGG